MKIYIPKTTYQYFKRALFLVLTAFSVQAAMAQPGRDGAMEIRISFGQYYANCGTTEIDNEDFNTDIRLKDYPDVDGAGAFSSGVVSWTGPFAVCGTCCNYYNSASVNRTFTYGARNTLGPQPTPLGIQAGFTSWEDDCFGCAGGSICLSGCGGAQGRNTYEASCGCGCITCNEDDAYSQKDQFGSNYLRFRDVTPNAFTYKGLTYGGDGTYSGSYNGIDYGGTYSTFWTPPCPDTFWADRPIICDPGYVTLQSGGAVFGGTYRWYKENLPGPPIFIQETADSFFTLYVDRTTTYRVYTKNPVAPSAPGGTQTESWSYRNLTIYIDKPVITGVVANNPLCADSASGSIVISATTAIPPLSYSIDNGVTWSASNTFTNLRRGVYLIKVKNAVCEVPPYGLPVQLLDPPALSSTIGRVDSVRCNGGADGAIELSVSGGTGPFTYAWTSGATTEDIYSVPAGIYSVVIRDRNGCLNSNTATVYQPTPLVASIAGDSVSCAGAGDGSAYVTVSGGTPPYSFLWSNGVTNDTASSLRGGLYTCVVNDARNCRQVLSVNIFEAAPLQLSISKTDVTCYAANNGTATVDSTMLGGVPPYSYNWSPAGPNSAARTGLSAGTYSVTVQDAAGCTATGSVVISQPDSIAVSALIFDVRCNGRANGKIDVTISGGTTPYGTAWSGPGGFTATSEDVDSLRGGSYLLVITDGHACNFTRSYDVNEPAPLSDSIAYSNIRCFGDRSGAANVIISGGTSPYNILWNTFDTTASINSLVAGTYTVIITDDNGCVKADAVNITQSPQIIITNVSVTDCRCNGDSTGGISFAAGGGRGILHYQWSTGPADTITSLLNVPAGTYFVTVTDDSGCFAVRSFEVRQPLPFITEVTGNSPTCSDNSTGFAVVSVSGSTPPYNYLWSTTPPQTGIMGINLRGGLYIVTITDRLGCTTTDSVTIIPPDPITVTTVPFAVKCFGGSDGRVSVSALGGNRPYRYILNGILQNDSVFTGLTAGNYIIVVEDNNACVGNTTFTITQPTGFSVNLTATPRVIPRGMQTQLLATAISPLPVIGYNWYSDPMDSLDFSGCASSRNCANPVARPSVTTLYTVEALNSDTCSVFDSIRVTVLQDRAVFIPTAFSPNGDGKNETFDFQILGAQSVEVFIFNRWGEKLYYNASQVNGAGQGWDGTFKGQMVPLDAYVYQFNVTYYDGKQDVLTGTVTVVK